MTQFTKDMIPASITTTEQLAVWVSEVHAYRYGTKKVTEAINEDGEPVDVFVAETDTFYNTAPTTPEYRHLARHSIKLRPEYKIFGKIWEHTQILGDDTVPLEMRS